MTTIENATSLRNLLDILISLSAEELKDIDLSYLPTFGGDEPRKTDLIWSWDETHLLTGEGAPGEDWVIVSREDAEAWWNQDGY